MVSAGASRIFKRTFLPVWIIWLYLEFGTFVSFVNPLQQVSGGWTEGGHFFLFSFSVTRTQIQQERTRVWCLHKRLLHILYNTTKTAKQIHENHVNDNMIKSVRKLKCHLDTEDLSSSTHTELLSISCLRSAAYRAAFSSGNDTFRQKWPKPSQNLCSFKEWVWKRETNRFRELKRDNEYI